MMASAYFISREMMLHRTVALMESPVPHYCQMNILWLQLEGFIDDLTEVTGLYEENISLSHAGPKLIKSLCQTFKPGPTADWLFQEPFV